METVKAVLGLLVLLVYAVLPVSCGAASVTSDITELDEQIERYSRNVATSSREITTVNNENKALRAKIDKAESVNTEVVEFSRSNMPQLVLALNQLDQAISRAKASVDSLSIDLGQLKRVIDEDEEIQRWSNYISQMSVAKNELLTQRDDAFIQYRKYQLNPARVGEDAAFAAMVRTAEQSARESQLRFQDLLAKETPEAG